MPFPDVVGKTGTVPPAQMVNAVPNENVGVMFAFTETVSVTGGAHDPDAGVNV